LILLVSLIRHLAENQKNRVIITSMTYLLVMLQKEILIYTMIIRQEMYEM